MSEERQVSLRRPHSTFARSEYEELVDFDEVCLMRGQGASWEDITDALNEVRPYVTTAHDNKKIYLREMKNKIIVQNTDEAAEMERARILEELDWLYAQAAKKWQALKNIDYVDEISGRVEDPNDQTKPTEDDDESIEGFVNQSKKYSKKKIGLVEQHGAKYLEIMMKITLERAKITGVSTYESKSMELIDMLKNKVLDDGGKARGIKFTSEQEVLDAFEPAEVVVDIEENLEINHVK